MATKTNAMRLVEQAGIPYREVQYEYDEDHLDGMHVSEVTGIDPEKIYKTLVARGPRSGIHVFCIPVCCELDLKKAAKATGDKSMELVQVKELLSLTGYIRGGCSPVGMKKKYPTHIEESCMLFDWVAVSAGERGRQILLEPSALVGITQATLDDIIA